jgi:alkyldihydroxyacetonephosphate synthase
MTDTIPEHGSDLARRRPVPPIPLADGGGTPGERLESAVADIDQTVRAELASACPIVDVIDGPDGRAEASRDWWPLALHWALAGAVPRLAAVVARPRSVAEVSALLAVCDRHRVPVTPAGGRSGVCGGSLAVHGGVLLDLTELSGIVSVDAVSGIVHVRSGTFGPDLEDELRDRHGLSVGHFPQSFDLATVGGWVACRGAGQYSTRYGKIEDMVVGLEVVLANGRVVATGGHAAAAAGPDLDQVFVGSEGTLGVITSVWLRAHPVAEFVSKAAYRLPDLDAAFEACRRTIRAGATPAVLRLYDPIESARSHGGDGSDCALLVLDEGHPSIVGATMDVVDEHVRSCGGVAADTGLVDRWLGHRNDTGALQALTERGFVVDTMEVTVAWSDLRRVYDAVRSATLAVPGSVNVSAHLSHSYPDGACLYFSFAARPDRDDPTLRGPEWVDRVHRAMWDAAQGSALAAGANLSHHHGIGLNRGRFMASAIGESFTVLVALKEVLDPNGILNPGKLGLPDPFGEVRW